MQWLVLSLVLAVVGLLLAAWSRRQRVASGLPAGEVVYADTGAWERCERPLFSARYGLSGKPDYLVREQGHVIPVEVKLRREAAAPYEGDLLQLGAYCLLVEDEFGRRPPHGYLRYREATFRVEYGEALRRELLRKLEAMRKGLGMADMLPDHRSPQRCRGCGHREHCARRLA